NSIFTCSTWTIPIAPSPDSTAFTNARSWRSNHDRAAVSCRHIVRHPVRRAGARGLAPRHGAKLRHSLRGFRHSLGSAHRFRRAYRGLDRARVVPRYRPRPRPDQFRRNGRLRPLPGKKGPELMDILAAFLLVLGALLMLIAAIGIIR